ncbi:calcium-binding protein [Methylobacterium sp. 88A]|uniref:calcium-binding protein n=1 Tax=Methylobacterium sp. 88A TaxID=1131813 RepID=UPI000363931A|nr:calcium-binding protein [Methylobacterium sp. 88A]
MTGTFDGATYNGDDTDETVIGTNLYEILFGKGGKDSLNGAGGNDVIYGGSGTDLIHGGTGDDYLFAFANERWRPVIDGDKLYGDAGNDQIVAGVARTSLRGGLIDGGADDDTAEIYASSDSSQTDNSETMTFTLTAATSGSYVRVGSTNMLLVKNVEHLSFFGSYEKDIVTGGASSDVIQGGGGDDVLKGGAGDDYLDGGSGLQDLDGGSGFDIASLNLADATESLSLIAGGTIAIGAHGTLTGIEGFAAIYTGSGSDKIAVGSVKDLPPDDGTAEGYKFTTSVDAGAGDDVITGGNRRDTVYGGTGADKIKGGDGNDSLYAEAGQTYEVAGRTSNDVLQGGNGNDVLVGGWGRDHLYGDAGNDTLTYQVNGTDSFADTFNGGAGDDTLGVNGTSGATTIELILGASTALKFDGISVLTATSVEAVTVSSYSNGKITITGGDLTDSIRLYGPSDDTVRTFGGSDTIYANGGTDIIDTGTGDDVVGVYIGGKDIVRTGAGNDTLTVVDDTFEASRRTALYDAGANDDTVIFRATEGGSFDGTYVRHGTTIVGRIVNYEHLTYVGSGTDTTFAGTGYDDTLYMGWGNDTASGGVGNDVIRGGAGSDTLDGGVGMDTLDYGDKAGSFDGTLAPNLAITLKTAATSKVVVSSTETDSIKNFENVVGGHGNDAITGASDANVLDGGDGSDVLKGLGGADTFVFSTTLKSSNVDTIVDFFASTASIHDTIRLDDAIFSGLPLGDLAGTAFKDLSKGALDADDRILYDHHTGVLSYDADGSGMAKAALQFATLVNKAALTNLDFEIA